MGIRCSLLGHEFAEAELDREREERGEEVVITIREVKTCERCGAEQVLSENTEVRPVEPIEDVQDDTAVEPTGESTGVNAPGDAEEETELLDGEHDTAEAGVNGGAFGGASADAATETDPESDDGVIIDGDDEEPDRTAGEWPDAADTRVDERDVPAEAGPEVEVGTEEAGANEGTTGVDEETASDEGAEILGGGSTAESPEPDTSGIEGAAGANAPDEYDGAAGERDTAGANEGMAGANAPDSSATDSSATDSSATDSSATDDAEGETEILDGDAGGEAEGQSASEWPDPAGEDRGFDAEPGGERTEIEFSGLAPEGERDVRSGTPSESPSLDAEDGTAFVCPECGFSKPVEQSSLRAGDICPECRKGYLTEE